MNHIDFIHLLGCNLLHVCIRSTSTSTDCFWWKQHIRSDIKPHLYQHMDSYLCVSHIFDNNIPSMLNRMKNDLSISIILNSDISNTISGGTSTSCSTSIATSGCNPHWDHHAVISLNGTSFRVIDD